ncbi:GDSL-type esterase/lipase family protein [Mucilaginibacter sabulilitoris]|uniref:GDSL-type esterase/lipase family protein n=1 Tax=Mucilaginibacter sabulilitoris TaxID=1173583 RepID=A0ABZ0U0I8_9SPHI|nr:GDSL-type esterase/lipase family protein [Mucilaginibacter sabulilitoris]WPU96895.1 GDSL-type esterase/lipase family protein [Mucilaginibacter sabulilitoris]
MKFKRLILLLVLITPAYCSAQTTGVKWAEFHAPLQQGLNGLSSENGNYPYLNFVTNTNNMIVRLVYGQVKNTKSKLAESKCKLYALDDDGKWTEFEGTRSGEDSVSLLFRDISIDNPQPRKSIEYRLFLPIGQALSDIKIGTDARSQFELLPLQPEKQIFIYKQIEEDKGIEAGNSWPARLERELDRPIIVFDDKADRKVFLGQAAKAPTKAVFLEICAYRGAGKINEMLKDARQIEQAGIPVFITPCEHESLNKSKAILNEIARQIAGGKGIYILSRPATDDWAAFNAQVRLVLQESGGDISTMRPLTQHRDRNYDWRRRHADELTLNKTKAPHNIIFANSIIHYWGGLPQSTIVRGKDSWDTYLQPLAVQNMGFGWDRIENVLWRIYHDELDGFKADHILLMIGTNNLQSNTDDEIIRGLRQLITAAKTRQSQSRIIISGILSRRNMETRVAALNVDIEKLAAEVNIKYINPGAVFLNDAGKIKEELFGDGLHPNAAGYRLLAPIIAEAFSEH